VTVVIERKQAVDAVLIPQAAVLTDQGGAYVLAVNDEDKVEARRIETGQRFGPNLVVDRGPEGRRADHPLRHPEGAPGADREARAGGGAVRPDGQCDQASVTAWAEGMRTSRRRETADDGTETEDGGAEGEDAEEVGRQREIDDGGAETEQDDAETEDAA
jgi:hypothetical protein